jgi:potassium channel subfamily K
LYNFWVIQGYGDITPEDNPKQQTFVWMYAFTGVVFLGAAVTDLVVAITQLIQSFTKAAQQRALEKSNALIAHAMEKAEECASAAASAADKGAGAFLSTGAQERKRGCWNQVKVKMAFIWEKEKTLVKLLSILVQLAVVWSMGAGLLVWTDQITFFAGLYCSIITSLSVGYGDVSPQSQNARLAFTFYMPFSVVVVVGCIPQLIQIMLDVSTVQVRAHINGHNILHLAHKSVRSLVSVVRSPGHQIRADEQYNGYGYRWRRPYLAG